MSKKLPTIHENAEELPRSGNLVGNAVLRLLSTLAYQKYVLDTEAGKQIIRCH